MDIRDIGLGIVDAVFIFVVLVVCVGWPMFIIRKLVIDPIVVIRKEVKGGKTFRQALNKAYK